MTEDKSCKDTKNAKFNVHLAMKQNWISMLWIQVL